MRLDGNGLAIDPNAGSRCCQQLSNAHFRFFVIAFAEVMIAHAPCRIDEVERRPIVMTEPTPDRAVVVEAMGYVTPLSFAALRMLSTFSSNENSGVCTPMTTSPCSLYRAAQARTYGSVRSQ